MWQSVLLCTLLASGAVRAAVITAQDSDCPAVRSALLEKGVAESALASSGEPSEVCQAGSCCSRPWELGIRDLVHREFRRRLVDSTDQVKNLLQLQANAVQDAILRLIHKTNQSTIDSYTRETDEDSQTHDHIALRSLPELFGKFMRYFQSDLSDPELETAVSTFFDDLFVMTYGRGAQLNATFDSCLREKRSQIRPFRNVPFRIQEKLLRTFGLARFYLQSLYGGLEVLDTTTQFECSTSCYQALTRLGYCPLCNGHGDDTRPCNEFCFNVMRGCMAPLSLLSESWQAYVEVLRKLATSLQAGNNVETNLQKLYLNISEAMTLVFTYQEEVDRMVRESCGPSPSPSEPSKRRRRRRREIDMQYRSSGDLGGVLPPLPQREQLIDLAAEREQLHKLLRAFNSDVEQHRLLYQMLPEQACNDVAQDRPAPCWNGTQIGQYGKPVAGVGLDSQRFNPEVTVPAVPDVALTEKVDLLDQIQQGSNDKLATMPPGDEYIWNEHQYVEVGSGWSADGSGGSIYDTDDEDVYPRTRFCDYDDENGSGSGDGGYFYQDCYGDYEDEDVTSSPTIPDGDDGLEIPGETDVVPPGVSVDPAPTTGQPAAKPPPGQTTAKPSAAPAPAAAAALWTLVAAALLAARL